VATALPEIPEWNRIAIKETMQAFPKRLILFIVRRVAERAAA